MLLAALSAFVRGEDDPAAKWLSVYAWVQTADQLAGADQWPLALGSYLEAQRLLGDLAAAHPAFEPEMVAYRREALSGTIATSEARLTTDEHDVMMKYLDFIESLELGEAQRYRNEFEEAYGTLGMAKALLDEIVEIKPVGFREAVTSQYARLESGLTWLDSQIHFEAVSRPDVILDETIDWGTTRFVKESDLPKTEGVGPIASELFPAALVVPLKSEEPVEEGAATPESPSRPASPNPGPKRFRMNTRSSEAGESVADPAKSAVVP